MAIGFARLARVGHTLDATGAIHLEVPIIALVLASGALQVLGGLAFCADVLVLWAFAAIPLRARLTRVATL